VDVSVVIPVYNRADLLPHTLRSILAQSHPPKEIVVVDDGSTDATADVAAAFGDPVRLVRIRNSGDAAARNAGIAKSRCAWIAFCDSDDLWHPEKLACQVAAHRRLPDAQYSFTDFAIVTDDMWREPHKFAQAPSGYWEPGREIVDGTLWVYREPFHDRLLAYQPIFPSTILLSKACFAAVGPMNESLTRLRAHDAEFAHRCTARSPIVAVAAPLVGIRKHAGNFSRELKRDLADSLTVLAYCRDHHPAARLLRDAFDREIRNRCRAAIGAAYDDDDFALIRALWRDPGVGDADWKIRVKHAIARLPPRVATAVAALSRFLAWRARGAASDPQAAGLKGPAQEGCP